MCTTIGFSYKAGVVFGRTLEVGVPLDNKVGYVPKNMPDFIPTRNGSFSTKYATLGTMFFSVASFGDGLNEHGLMGSNNLFPGYASFAKEDKADKINLTTSRAFDYLLTRCATVKEVRAEAENLCITEKGETDTDLSTEMHFYFMDAAGESIVLEPNQGRLSAYENPFGVLTNAPEFPWHATNLRNYLHLQPENVDGRSFTDAELTKLGQGTGAVGLPGDFTPPSRFIRSAYFVANTPKDLNRNEAILQGFRILSQADIPEGAVKDPVNGHLDETLYTSIMDTQQKAYLIKQHTYIDIQPFYLEDFKDKKEIVFVDLNKEMPL